jgi:hypothetical protein
VNRPHTATPYTAAPTRAVALGATPTKNTAAAAATGTVQRWIQPLRSGWVRPPARHRTVTGAAVSSTTATPARYRDFRAPSRLTRSDPRHPPGVGTRHADHAERRLEAGQSTTRDPRRGARKEPPPLLPGRAGSRTERRLVGCPLSAPGNRASPRHRPPGRGRSWSQRTRTMPTAASTLPRSDCAPTGRTERRRERRQDQRQTVVRVEVPGSA